jgi:hypothetical protein
MIKFKNTKVKDFCKDIVDVEYIVGWDISKRKLDSEQNYIDLEILYGFNDCRKSFGQTPYMQILTDDSGSRYAMLSEDGAKYALDNDLSFIDDAYKKGASGIIQKKSLSDFVENLGEEENLSESEYEPRDANDIPLMKAISEFVDDSLEDKICQKCGNILGLNMTKKEFFSNIKNMIYSRKCGHSDNSVKKDPWANVFLTFKDIPGSYMN